MAFLTVVIIAYNSQATIEACLRSLAESNYKDYELVVVNNGSKDALSAIVRRQADKVIDFEESMGMSEARNRAMQEAASDVMVNIDPDVLVRPDTLLKISNFFLAHPDIDALTGLLSKEHPNKNFFSQYKNLYMHYIFKKLPEEVNFLYGSIHAFRRPAVGQYDTGIRLANDTALGQELVSRSRKIAFLKDLEVVHLKKYNFRSFIKNDFQIPLDWAKIFLKYKGWRQLGRNKTGFAHSPKEQLLSVVIAPCLAVLILLTIFHHPLMRYTVALALFWLILNFRFFMFLAREKGLSFGVLSVPITCLDNIIMSAGIACGIITGSIRKGYRVR